MKEEVPRKKGSINIRKTFAGAARQNEDLRSSGFEIQLELNDYDNSPRAKKRGSKLKAPGQPGGFSKAFLQAVNKSMQVPTSTSKVYTRFDAPKPNGKHSDMQMGGGSPSRNSVVWRYSTSDTIPIRHEAPQ